MAKNIGLLVKVAGDGNQFAAAVRTAGALELEPILHLPKQPAVVSLGLAATTPSTWLRMRGSGCTWDDAHQFLASGHGLAAGPGQYRSSSQTSSRAGRGGSGPLEAPSV